MGFGQEMKDFLTGFKAGSDFMGGVQKDRRQRARDEESDRRFDEQMSYRYNALEQRGAERAGYADSGDRRTAEGLKTAAASAGADDTGYSVDPVAEGLDDYQKAFLNAVSGPESRGRYNLRYSARGGTRFPETGRHPGIYESGPAGPSSAAGRYQFVKSTWDDITGGNVPFTRENQDLMAWKLGARDYQKTTGRDLHQDLRTRGFTPEVARALGGTWAGLKDNPSQAIGWFRSSMMRYKDAAGRPAGAIPAPERATPAVPGRAGVVQAEPVGDDEMIEQIPDDEENEYEYAAGGAVKKPAIPAAWSPVKMVGGHFVPRHVGEALPAVPLPGGTPKSFQGQRVGYGVGQLTPAQVALRKARMPPPVATTAIPAAAPGTGTNPWEPKFGTAPSVKGFDTSALDKMSDVQLKSFVQQMGKRTANPLDYQIRSAGGDYGGFLRDPSGKLITMQGGANRGYTTQDPGFLNYARWRLGEQGFNDAYLYGRDDYGRQQAFINQYADTSWQKRSKGGRIVSYAEGGTVDDEDWAATHEAIPAEHAAQMVPMQSERPLPAASSQPIIESRTKDDTNDSEQEARTRLEMRNRAYTNLTRDTHESRTKDDAVDTSEAMHRDVPAGPAQRPPDTGRLAVAAGAIPEARTKDDYGEPNQPVMETARRVPPAALGGSVARPDDEIAAANPSGPNVLKPVVDAVQGIGAHFGTATERGTVNDPDALTPAIPSDAPATAAAPTSAPLPPPRPGSGGSGVPTIPGMARSGQTAPLPDLPPEVVKRVVTPPEKHPATRAGLRAMNNNIQSGGGQTAVPEPGAQRQAMNAFLSDGQGMTREEYRAAAQRVDPQGRLDPKSLFIKVQQDLYDYYRQQGNKPKADAASMATLFYGRRVSRMAGGMAAAALDEGDMITAAQWMSQAYAHVPDNHSLRVDRLVKGSNGEQMLKYQVVDRTTGKVDAEATGDGLASLTEMKQMAGQMFSGQAWAQSAIRAAEGLKLPGKRSAADMTRQLGTKAITAVDQAGTALREAQRSGDPKAIQAATDAYNDAEAAASEETGGRGTGALMAARRRFGVDPKRTAGSTQPRPTAQERASAADQEFERTTRAGQQGMDADVTISDRYFNRNAQKGRVSSRDVQTVLEEAAVPEGKERDRVQAFVPAVARANNLTPQEAFQAWRVFTDPAQKAFGFDNGRLSMAGAPPVYISRKLFEEIKAQRAERARGVK